MTNKPTVSQWLTFAIAAIQKAAQIIGSIEWKGRFRKRTDAAISALQDVCEAQQEAIESLTKEVEELRLTMSQNDDK